MKSLYVLTSVLLCLTLASLVSSCAADGKSTEVAASVLCGGCGEFKGDEACCAEGAETCSSCELAKGSPGCCKMERGEDVTLCSCGEIKGSEGCCADDATACGDCGKNAGSPGCCHG